MRKEEIRQRIFTSEPLETREVSTGGAKVILHRLNWGELQQARSAAVTGETFDATKHAIALLVLAARDEAGERVFEPADIHALLEANGAELDVLVMANLDLQGLTKVQADKGKES